MGFRQGKIAPATAHNRVQSTLALFTAPPGESGEIKRNCGPRRSEKVPILQVFEAFDYQSELLDNSNQLILFGL